MEMFALAYRCDPLIGPNLKAGDFAPNLVHHLLAASALDQRARGIERPAAARLDNLRREGRFCAHRGGQRLNRGCAFRQQRSACTKC